MVGLLGPIGPTQIPGLLGLRNLSRISGVPGIGALAGIPGTGKPSANALGGNLPPLFDPAEMRRAQINNALVQAGLAMMNPDPHAPPQGFGGVIGRAAKGAVQGMQQGRENYTQDALWKFQTDELQRKRQEEENQRQALEALLPTLPPDLQKFVRAFPGKAGEVLLKLQGGGEPYTLGPGQTRFGPDNKPIATGGPDEPKYDTVILEDGVYEIERGSGNKRKIGERPNRNEGEGRDFKQARDLRTDYTKAAEPFEKKRVAYQNIVSAYEGAVANPDNPGPADIALIFSYMKMLDPGSTVMQGEYANAANAGGVPENIITLYNNLRKGDKLSPDLRDAFLDQATAQYQSQLSSYSTTRQTYQDLARQRGLNPDEVAPDYTYGVVPFARKSNLHPDNLKSRGDELRAKYGLRPRGQ